MEIGEIEALRIDRAIGVSGLAAQPNGEELIGIAVAPLVVLHGAGNPQVVAPIRHLRQLTRDDPRAGEGLIDTKVNGMPRRLSRCRVDRREAMVSYPTPKTWHRYSTS